jgi:hypothetical protein
MMKHSAARPGMPLYCVLLILFAAPAALLFAPDSVGAGEKDMVTYVGGDGNQELHGILRLSDGSLLVSGTCDNLSWVPARAKKKTLPFETPTKRKSTGKWPFLMRISPDGRKITHVARLPKGSAEDLRYIKTTSTPGKKTGVLYVSGTLGEPDGDGERGYFIGRLDGNFVTSLPTKFEWVREAKAGKKLRRTQPWDVGPKGRVLYAVGKAYSYDWMAVLGITADGKDAIVPHWRTHWYTDEAGERHEFHGPVGDAPGTVYQSGIVLKIWGRGDFRSWNRQDFLKESSDGNGGRKQGKWPLDAMFPGYWNPETKKTVDVTGTGKGYYGYRWGANPCGCVGAIAIDRRTGGVYIGGNNQSRLPGGNPDFEPWVVAMDRDGKLRWWQRLYAESKGVSTPDQYVDAVAIDYRKAPDKGGSLVVVARAHGNNVNNFWKGNEIKHPVNPGHGFQNQFTGTHGNIHYQWIGRMTCKDGTMLNATYFAEYAEGAKFTAGNMFKNPLLDHWPSFSAGWPNVNTTRIKPHSLYVGEKGNVYLAAKGRRVITTSNAHQEMPSPTADKGSRGQWSDFVRVYTPGLTTLRYSSLLHGRWNWDTGKGGSAVNLSVVTPVKGGLAVTGTAPADTDADAATGDPMPTANIPEWGKPKRTATMGVLGVLHFEKQ